MATLNRQQITDALTRLGQIALASGQTVELLLVGGGVMVLEFGARASTRDLDVLIMSPRDFSAVRSWATMVADENAWAEGWLWLNDAAKGFLIGTTSATPLFSAPGITVYRPAVEQLLAMKLCAWRDDVDIADARRLLEELTGDHDSVWQRVTPHLQPGRELNARYAFDDLWEDLHGHS